MRRLDDPNVVRGARLLCLISALGCGSAATGEPMSLQGQASIPSGGQPSIGAVPEQGNAATLVVPMSMVLPKKPVAAPTVPTVPTVPMMAAPAAGSGVQGMAPGAGAPMVTPPVGAAGAPASSPMAGAAGSGVSNGSAPGADISGVPEAELAMLRELCVTQINMYRATLTDAMLAPLTRATPEQEECSQRAAKMDGDTGQGHGAFRAGLCSATGLSAQNSCPGYPVGGFGGGATIADAFTTCLAQMWAEGEPPVPRQQCVQDSTGCFLQHGHYMNMSDPSFGSVSCSFYKMSDGRSYWMSQDFAFAGGLGGWGRR